MEIVQGPDFPTGGTILGREGIRAAYATGRGRVVIRAKAFVEESTARQPLPDRRHRAALPGQQGRSARAHRRAGQGRQDRRHQRPARRIGPHRHAHDHRAEARRAADEGAEQPLQAHRHCSRPSASTCWRWSKSGTQPRVLTLKRALQEYVAHRQDRHHAPHRVRAGAGPHAAPTSSRVSRRRSTSSTRSSPRSANRGRPRRRATT